MNKHLDTLLNHAKEFDDIFIKTNEFNLYCANETLIKDYIIAKSVLTPELKTTIIIESTKLSSIQAEFKDILGKTGLDKKTIKYPRNSSVQLKDDVMAFKNDSLIYFTGCEEPAERFEDTIQKVIYISNSALDSLFGLKTIENFKDMVDETTRVIYNFEG